MELRNINTFLHIAELHSFSSAARELGYSQSAVSAQISQLETELGTPLFDRVGKTVRLTDAGQTFQSYARTLLITAQQAKAALVPARAVSGTLRVALADSVCSTFLPDLLQQFHALCPQVELVLRTATADEMLRLLSANQIDLAYTLDQPLLLPSLTLAVNVPEPVCFVAPAGHPLADKAEVPLDVLAQQEFLLTERGMSYREPSTSASPPVGCLSTPTSSWAAPRCSARWWSAGWGSPSCPSTSSVLPSPPGVSPASMSPTALSPCTGSCSITRTNGSRPR